ncbi:MAG TPA: dihydrofolate reductase family protein [Patescibacteria group bacterium]|nr:dihydrofolate reductase family protein [Patescibacteria group bacterium]
MKITLAMVLSVDGKSTKWDLPDQSWASEEDKTHLIKLISENDLILMGGKTYETAKKNIKPKAGKLRIVITHDPERFSGDQKENQLEFTNRPIPELIQTLESRGFKQMLLLSGEGLNKQFFEAGLINEIILTVEPVIFGRGRGIIAEANLDLKLKLLSFEKLNNKGTMLLHYQVL